MTGSSERSSSSDGTTSIRPAARSRFDERPQPVDQVVGLEPADPLAVEPLEPFAIEDRAALVDGVELEPLDDLVDRQDLLLGARSPSRGAPGS